MHVQIFSTIEAENKADILRYVRMTPGERLQEAAFLQERIWGKGWTKRPMKKVASFEQINW